MIVTSGSSNPTFAKDLARLMGVEYKAARIGHFPDGELHITVPRDKETILVQSLALNPNEYMMELLLMLDYLESKGSEVTAVIPYLAYARQDEEFHSGEAISFHTIAKLLQHYCDNAIMIDVHLHRIGNIKKMLPKAVNVSVMPLIGEYLKRHVKFQNPVVIGPDEESEQWAKQIANILNCDHDIFIKKRFSSTKVAEMEPKSLNLKGRDVVIIDDIISTGGTIANAVKIAKKHGAKKISVACAHGLFVGGAVGKIKPYVSNILSTDTVPGKYSKIRAAPAVANYLKKRK